MKKRERIDLYKEKARIDEILRSAEVIAKTPLLPCEDEEKVARALRNIVDGEIKKEEYGDRTYLVARSKGSSDIEKLFNYFRSKQVLATLRRILKKYSSQEEIVIYLHKQAAYVGAYSIAEPGESPGGEIIVTIKVEDPSSVISALTRF